MTTVDSSVVPTNQTNSSEMAARVAENVLLNGNLEDLSHAERLFYYKSLCEALGLNPLTKPFDFIETDAGLKLYPNKECAAQLRAKHGISVRIVHREMQGEVCVVTAQASMPDGRTDESIGAVPLVKEAGEWKVAQSGKKYFAGNGTFKPLAPEARANAYMRSETKAKRRATFSLCGLGMADPPDEEGPRWDFDLTAEPQQKDPAPPPPPPAADNELEKALTQFAGLSREQRLAKFGELKHDLQELLGEAEGTAEYYRILKEVEPPVEHAYQLTNMAQAKAAFRSMWAILRAGVPARDAL